MKAVRAGGMILIVLLWGAGTGLGCFSAGKSDPPKFYVLSPAVSDATPSSSGARAGSAVLLLPVQLPNLLDRPQMVVRKGSNEVEILEFDRWAEPLGEGIEQVLLEDLAGLLPTARLYMERVPDERKSYLVLRVRIDRFESGPDAAVHCKGWWVLSSSSDAFPAVETFSVIEEPIEGGASSEGGFNGDAVVAAMNRALAALAGEIATAIRERG